MSSETVANIFQITPFIRSKRKVKRSEKKVFETQHTQGTEGQVLWERWNQKKKTFTSALGDVLSRPDSGRHWRHLASEPQN